MFTTRTHRTSPTTPFTSRPRPPLSIQLKVLTLFLPRPWLALRSNKAYPANVTSSAHFPLLSSPPPPATLPSHHFSVPHPALKKKSPPTLPLVSHSQSLFWNKPFPHKFEYTTPLRRLQIRVCTIRPSLSRFKSPRPKFGLQTTDRM